MNFCGPFEPEGPWRKSPNRAAIVAKRVSRRILNK